MDKTIIALGETKSLPLFFWVGRKGRYHASSLDDACSHNWQLCETGACAVAISLSIIFGPESAKWLVLDRAKLRLPL